MSNKAAPIRLALVRLIRLSLPVLIANFSIMIMVAVDTYFVGTMGDPHSALDRIKRTQALAGLAFAGPLIWVVSSLFSGAIAAINTFAAQVWGEGSRGKLGLYFGQAAGLALIFAVPCAILGLVCPWFFKFLPIKEQGVWEAASGYSRIRFMGMLFPLCNIAASGLFEGIGRMSIPTYVALFVNALNAFLDWLLVPGNMGFPSLGVKGAAWASVISSCCGTFVYAALILRKDFRKPYISESFHLPGGRALISFLKVGIPQAASWFSESFLWATFLILVNGLGTVIASAQQITVSILHFAFLPGVAIGTATTTLVGQAVGRKDFKEADLVFRCSVGLTVGYMGTVGVFFLLFRDFLLGIFTDNPSVIEVGRTILFFAALWQIFDGLYIASVGALRGAGDTVWPAVIYFGAGWLLFLPCAYVFTRVFQWGVVGAWGAAASFIALAGILAAIRWFGGKWKSLRILENTSEVPFEAVERGGLSKGFEGAEKKVP